MAIKKRHVRRYFILPSSLLVLNAVEDLLIYKLQSTVHDPYLLTAIIIGLFLAGFSLVGFVVAPWIELLVEKSYVKGRGFAGTLKSLTSLALAFAVIYWIYFKIYIDGVGSLAVFLPFL